MFVRLVRVHLSNVHSVSGSFRNLFNHNVVWRATRFVSPEDLKMRYVAAYLLAVLGGKEQPASSDIEKILSSVGIEADGESVKRVIEQLKGKKIDDVIKAGKEKLASMPAGGGAVSAAPAAAAAPAAEKKEEKKEAAKKEDSESDDDMGFGLFD